jgi:hypothetical protein
VEYKGKRRDLALTYEETPHEIKFITIHPLKLNQKQNRIETGRWEKEV